MRAAAILGPGNFSKWVAKFQRIVGAEWSSELSRSIDATVIFGGDGTIHRHLPTLVDLQLPVLFVPCGSGNDFARALKLRSVDDSLNAWRSFVTGGRNVRDIDLGIIRESKVGGAPATHEYFCCVAGVGIDTEIVRRANALPKWIRSHGGYALSAPREFLRFAPFPMKISCDEAPTSSFHPTILAAFANAPTYGGGMKIAPQAKLDDGKLDVCIVRAMDRFKLFCLFPTVYFGRHLSFDEVEYAQAETAKLETEYSLDVYADGEYVCQTPVEFAVARGALKVIIPE
jgi:diacylglycerol kinase (ATP)